MRTNLTQGERDDRTLITRRNAIKAAGVAGMASLAGCAGSDDGEWPSRQVEIVVPWAAGGLADGTARSLADAGERVTDASWGVVNQTGGSGSIGTQQVINSEPDGHTIGIMAAEINIWQHRDIADIHPSDVQPVMQYNETPTTICVHEDSEWDTIEDFIEHAADEGVSIGNSGTGGSYHIAAADFGMEAGISDDIEHIPYEGVDPAISAAVTQETDAVAGGASETAPQITDGPLEALGVMSDTNHPAIPDVTPFPDQGYDATLGTWLGTFVTPDIDDDTLDEIGDVFLELYEDEEFTSFMEGGDYLMRQRGPEELSEFMETEYDQFETVIDNLDFDD